MAMNPFPPQAYTRETMIKAYQWLQSQSPQIRELATTPDILISLFQKAQLQGKDALERPQLQNFKNELRSLAGMMGEFDTAEGTPTTPTPPAPSGNLNPATSPSTPATNPTASNPAPVTSPGTAASLAAVAQAAAMDRTSSVQLPQDSQDLHRVGHFVLDSKSLEWLEEIQRELNLESTSEALRLALSVGYGRLSELFPRRR